MATYNILLIGGTGFLGSNLTHRLAADGHVLTLPTRRREDAKHLLVLPTATVVQANVHDERQLDVLMVGQDVVISLVGILHSRSARPGQAYGPDFARAHVELPRMIAAASQRRGIKRLLHVSALQAGPDAPSGYLRSKAAGEAVLLAAKDALALTIFRPSVIYGPDDAFLNVFAKLLRTLPLLPLACANARFQPVFVRDVADCIADSLATPERSGQIYSLCGPNVYSLRQLVEYIGHIIGHPRPVIGLPDALSYLQALAMEFVPNGPMSRDNYYSMQVDSVCEAGCTLPFGRVATALESVAPAWLVRRG